MTDTELIARQAKQIAELRASAKTITWPVVHHDVLSALLDAAEELEALKQQWLKVCEIGRTHLERYALVGESFLIHGIPRMADENVRLREANAHWHTRALYWNAERDALRAENAKLREALGMMSTAAPRTVVDSLRPIEWAIAVVEEVQAERDDRDKLRERIALLEDLCRKAVDPCVSYWMVVEPGIRTALACKETHND